MEISTYYVETNVYYMKASLMNSSQWGFCGIPLRLEFRQSQNDGDMKELIRNTKQKPNETFNSFYESFNQN